MMCVGAVLAQFGVAANFVARLPQFTPSALLIDTVRPMPAVQASSSEREHRTSRVDSVAVHAAAQPLRRSAR